MFQQPPALVLLRWFNWDVIYDHIIVFMVRVCLFKDKGSAVPLMDRPVAMAIRVIKGALRERCGSALWLYDGLFVSVDRPLWDWTGAFINRRVIDKHGVM